MEISGAMVELLGLRFKRREDVLTAEARLRLVAPAEQLLMPLDAGLVTALYEGEQPRFPDAGAVAWEVQLHDVQMRFLGTDAVIANGTVDGVALTALNDGLTAMEMGVEFLPRLDGPGLGALGALIAMIKIEPRVAIFRVLGEPQGELLDCEEAGR